MTTTVTTTEAIRTALAATTGGLFAEKATNLLAVLGYRSDHVPPTNPASVGDFIAEYPAPKPGTQSEAVFADNAQSVRILFQFTDAEITSTTQGALLNAEGFSTGNARSFLFVAVELKGDNYARGQYVAVTREINKRWQIPTVVLFRTAAHRVTLAFVHRRPNRRDPNRDVLGSVSLIREIDAANPHRAHLDILADLSLQERLLWMDSHGKAHNFDGLLEAWLDALDTEALNRRFYRDLFDWFQRTVNDAKLPDEVSKKVSREEHVIRLITRLLFVWFIKEKGLVADDLFIENRISQLLKDYDADEGDSYYRAVLQNLFFATLNTEISERRFSHQSNDDHRNFSVYRYFDEIDDPDALLELFGLTPFINGGLFDCLDSFDATDSGGVRIDCFTDNARHRRGYSIPNRLFFDEDGLITLFDHYKFTVEENTPAEREVALDPELLGKVFENLLAAFNPETRKNARKETGSYYTPRAVVDYMVDEALVATLAQKAGPGDGNADFWQERLRYLLDYDVADADTLFEAEEKAAIVGAIAETKVLDPAVGSGAFPMGVLHKLTLALRRLDPGNDLWADLQRKQARRRAGEAFDTEDQADRDTELEDISATFERYRDSDFGRKLYLIQNGIYGVDIQPIATQIAKLRFFISLAIDQKPTGNMDDNYGIKPLPNLETRFVAANSLLGLDRPAQMALGETDTVKELQYELDRNRERHFHAKMRQQKLGLRDEDKRLRQGLAAALREADFSAGDADKIAQWDPYDQNASAGWFDAEYMFGVADGFDVVIGNPPYRQVRKGTYSTARFPYSEGKDTGKQNLYKLFVEHSYNLVKAGAIATLIVQSSLMCDLSSAATRELLLKRTRLRHVIEFPKAAPTPEAQVFQSVTQGTCIYQFVKSPPEGQPIRISVGNDAYTIAALRFVSVTGTTIEGLYPTLRCFPHVRDGSVRILEKIVGDNTIRPLRHYASSIVQGDLNLTTHSNRFSSKRTKVRLLRGRHVGRFVVKYDASTEYCDQGFLREQVKANREGVFLTCQQITGTNDERRLHFGVTENPPTDFLCGNSLNKLLLENPAHSKAFAAVLNSKFMDWFFRITSTNNHVQGYELEQLPIPHMTSDERRQLGNLTARVMKAKAANPNADTATLEAEIDRRVYALYGLTEAEIAAVEGR